MTVQCPNCDTKYRLDEDLVSQDGARVRCSRCSHVFSVSRPRADDEIDVLQDDEFEKFKDLNIAGGTETGSFHEEEKPRLGPSYEHKNGTIVVEIQPTQKPRTRAVIWVLLGIAVVSLSLGALLFFPGIKDTFLSWFGSDEQEPPKIQQEVLTEDQVSQISLHNVRQYFVANEKIGQLFVIEGKARNDFPKTMELIMIEASLFDGQGQVVQRQVFLAGNTVSLFQLQILSEEELQAALEAKVGVLANNTNLRPGMDVPFMVAFPNPPDTVQEYGLKVVEAQHPSQ